MSARSMYHGVGLSRIVTSVTMPMRGRKENQCGNKSNPNQVAEIQNIGKL
jgi:hypothetical protein